MNTNWLLLGLGAFLLLKARKRSNPCRTRRNPLLRVPKNLKAGERKALAVAKRLSKQFHGTETEVIELSPDERKALPRFVMAAGDLTEFSYAPDGNSLKGEFEYEHKSGDRGPFETKSRRKPILAVDPKTKRPVIVPAQSPMRLDSKRGFVG